MKKINLLILVLLAIVIIGCDNDPTDNNPVGNNPTGNDPININPTDNDVWENVTSFSQLYGTWENDGPINFTYEIELSGTWEDDVLVNVTYGFVDVNYTQYSLTFSEISFSQSYSGTSTITYSTLTTTNSYSNYSITYNNKNKTISELGKVTTTISGDDADEYWLSLKQIIEEMYTEETVTIININNSDYSYTIICNNYLSPYPEDFSIPLYNYQINQNGTKIKTYGIPGDDKTIFILNKVK